MENELTTVKTGLFLVMLTLLFGIGLGAGFGITEDSVKSYIADGIKANPDVHNRKSFSKIWRYAQRSHFHATGIAAFSIGLILLIMASSLTRKLKSLSSLLVGLGGLYPLSWFVMYLLAPSIGYRAAHQHFMTELFTYVGVIGLLLGILILCANLFFNLFQEKAH